MKVLFDTEVNHLGVLIENQNSQRIVALSTSDVFIDKSLISNFWETDSNTMDSGFQAHLYTRPGDVLVVRVSSANSSVIEQVSIAIKENYELWNSLAGVQISSHQNYIILVSNHPPPISSFSPNNFSWYQGRLLDAAASLFKKGEYSFLAFIFNRRLLDILGISHQLGDEIKNIAQSVSLFMDKNSVFESFQKGTVDCAETFLFSIENESSNIDLSRLSSSVRYVFKPAGGAAGIGLFSNEGFGVSQQDINRHVTELKTKGILPNRFQIQEFISGDIYGASAYFAGNGEFEILEIHQQMINQNGKFIGGRWTPAIESDQTDVVKKIYNSILKIIPFNFAGLLCLDFINGKVLEINPRVTASAPITHIFRIKDKFMEKYGDGFRVKQIDLNTCLNIPFEVISNGILRNQIYRIWKNHKVLCLPQGLNPFGLSRMIFINDDFDKTAQHVFTKKLISYSTRYN